MSLDQHISVTLVVNNSGLTQQGFGTIGRISYQCPFTDPSRTYRQKSEAISDGFAIDSPEVLFLNRVFSQRPRPPTAKILRGTRPPTQRYQVVATPVASKAYRLDVVGQGFASAPVTYTSDSSPTQAEIHNGLLTSFNAVVSKNYLATFPAVAFADFTYTVPAFADGKLHAVAHGRQTGDGPIQLTNTGGAVPGGTTVLTNYWLIRVGPDDLQLADSLAHALAGTFVALSNAGTGTQTIQHQAGTLSPTTGVTVTATSAGAWFALSNINPALTSVTQDHADPGIAADIADIQASDPDWYYLSTTYNSSAMVLAAAAAIEGLPFKAYMPEVVDTASENAAVNGGDVLDALAPFEYTRTCGVYRRRPEQMTTDGELGQLAALPVGSWTAAYKTVIGATADAFVSNQTTNLDAKRASYYKTEAGKPFFWEGKVGNHSYGFFDVTVSLDFVLDLLQKRGFALFTSLPKLPYTDEGIAMMAGTLRAGIEIAASDEHKIVAKGTPGDPDDPVPTVVFPRVRDVDPLIRAQRILPPGEISFRLQAAGHTVGVNVTVIF